MNNSRVTGSQKLVAELTVKDGKIVYDLNGLEAEPWDAKLATDAQYELALDKLPRPLPSRPQVDVH